MPMLTTLDMKGPKADAPVTAAEFKDHVIGGWIQA